MGSMTRKIESSERKLRATRSHLLQVRCFCLCEMAFIRDTPGVLQPLRTPPTVVDSVPYESDAAHKMSCSDPSCMRCRLEDGFFGRLRKGSVIFGLCVCCFVALEVCPRNVLTVVARETRLCRVCGTLFVEEYGSVFGFPNDVAGVF
jgi:hypothetical protein